MSGWWKQLTTSVSSVATSVTGPSSFPFREGQFKFHLGPFRVSEGVNSGIPEGSEFGRVCIWRAVGKDSVAIRVVKQMRTLQHPSMLKALAIKEHKEEILIATEYCVPRSEWLHSEDEEWRQWAQWQLKGVEKWLDDSKLDYRDRVTLITQAGECRLVLCHGQAGSDDTFLSTTASSTRSKLIVLSEDLLFLPTMSPGQQISFYSRVSGEDLPAYVRKHLLLPKCVAFRKTVMTVSGAPQPVSLEEVNLLFGAASLKVCGGEADFMALLAEIGSELLSGRVPLAEAVLLLLVQLLRGWTSGMSEAWLTAQLMPQLGRIFTLPNPQLKMAGLGVLKNAIPGLPIKVLTGEGLRLLARAQNDPDSAIRLEAFTVLGVAMDRLPGELKAKVSGPALCKGLTDQAEPTRMAALKVLKGWSEWIEGVEELAGRIGPVLLTISVKGTSKEEVEMAIDSIERVIIPRLRKRALSLGGRKNGTESGVISSSTAAVSKQSAEAPLPTVAASTNTVVDCASPQKPSKMRLGSIKKVT